MPKFTDAQGDSWDVRIDLGVLRDLEQATGKPIFQVMSDPARLQSEIIGSAEVIGKGLYFAVLEQAEKRGVSQEAFFKRITGAAVSPAARAFFEALLDCFPQPEENKAARPTSASRGHGRPSTAWQRLRALFSRGRTR